MIRRIKKELSFLAEGRTDANLITATAEQNRRIFIAYPHRGNSNAAQLLMRDVAAYQQALEAKIAELEKGLLSNDGAKMALLVEEPENQLHPAPFLTDTALKAIFSEVIKVSKIRRKITRLVRKVWEAASAVHSRMVVRKKGTQQSASRGRGQGIRTWVPAIFESDLSSALPVNINVLSMPDARGVLVVRTSSSAAVRHEQLHVTSVTSRVRASSRPIQHPTFAHSHD